MAHCEASQQVEHFGLALAVLGYVARQYDVVRRLETLDVVSIPTLLGCGLLHR